MSILVAMAVGYIARESVNPNQPSTTLRSSGPHSTVVVGRPGMQGNDEIIYQLEREREREREAFTTGRELRSEKRS